MGTRRREPQLHHSPVRRDQREPTWLTLSRDLPAWKVSLQDLLDEAAVALAKQVEVQHARDRDSNRVAFSPREQQHKSPLEVTYEQEVELLGTPRSGWGHAEPRFRYDGLGRALRRRAKLAGIEGFHPHKLRRTAAHRWLAEGGSESGLMAMAGWTRTDILIRYTRATAAERAAEEAFRLEMGNL